MASKTLACNNIKYEISYILLNHNKEKSILFLHGWGANKEVMLNAFKNTFCDFCHIYVDLPGFGNSSIQKPLNSYEIKEIICKFLDCIEKKPEIIVGHSFGGKIATLLNPKNLVLLSSAGIILPKRFSVKLKIKIFKILKTFGFGKFYQLFATKDVKGMSKTMYEMLKIVVNENFEDLFLNFKNKAYIFWGKDDNTTPIVAGKITHNSIKNSSFYVLEGDHFFFLDKANFIEKKVLTCEKQK